MALSTYNTTMVHSQTLREHGTLPIHYHYGPQSDFTGTWHSPHTLPLWSTVRLYRNMALSTYITTMVHSQTLWEHGTLHIHYHYGPQSDFTGTWHSPHTLPLWSTVRLYGNMALSTYNTTMVHSQTLREHGTLHIHYHYGPQSDFTGTWHSPHTIPLWSTVRLYGNMALSTYITTMVHSQTLREHGTLHIHYHYGPQSDFTGTWHSPHTLPLWSTVRLYGNMALSTYNTTMVHSQTLREHGTLHIQYHYGPQSDFTGTWHSPHTLPLWSTVRLYGNMALSTYNTTMVHSQTLREHGTLHIHYHYGPQSDFTGTWHSPHTIPLWSTVRLYGNMALSTYITTMVHSQTLREHGTLHIQYHYGPQSDFT